MRGTSLLMFAAVAGACQGPPSFAPPGYGPGAPVSGNLETPTKVDRIVQITKPEVDVLWVVDNSCSMVEEQQALAEAFPEFLSFFLGSNLDWHIGLVSTDTENPDHNGKLIQAGPYRFIQGGGSNPTQGPSEVFAQMTKLGVSGSASERGLLAAYRAIRQPTEPHRQRNKGFLRDDAALHIIVISDEEDQSAPMLRRQEFITFLQELKDDPETPVTLSAIVGPTPTGCRSARGDAIPGASYIAVARATGGLHRSICEEDWVPMLEELGLHAAGLRREYFLSEAPVPGTIEVWVVDGDVQYDGVEMPADKEYDNGDIERACDRIGGYVCFPFVYNSRRNSILIEREFVPNELAEIYIRYELLSGLQPEDDGLLEQK